MYVGNHSHTITCNKSVHTRIMFLNDVETTKAWNPLPSIYILDNVLCRTTAVVGLCIGCTISRKTYLLVT